MKFKFNLEKVLAHRKTIENIAQIDFQEALSSLVNEENKLKNMKQQMDLARSAIHNLQKNNTENFGGQNKKVVTGPTQGPEIVQIQHSENFLVLQAQRIESQLLTIEKAKKLVEEKREILRSRVTDSKILERLKEKRKQDFVQDALKKEQYELDEMSIMRTRLKDK